MLYRLAFVAIAICIFATESHAQVCQWTGQGGEKCTWVKLMWFNRDDKSKETPKPVTGFKDTSRYKRYKVGKNATKKHKIDADLLRDSVPEIFGDGDEPKADAFYFLSDAAFQPGEEFDGQDEIPLKDGRKFEKGPLCAMLGEKAGYLGFKKIDQMRDGKVSGVKWYSPIAIDMLNRKRKNDPLIYFGILAGVLVACIVVGIVGVKIGDKERGLDE